MQDAQPDQSAMPEIAVWIGIDWADQKHAYAMQIAGEERVGRGEIDHTPEAVEEFFTELGRRFPDQMIAVAMEQARGSLLFMLSKYGHLVLYPVHSSTMDHYRKSFYPSGAKSDPTDADLILELLRKHPDRLRPFRPDTVATRTIQFLVEARRDAVNDKTRYLNRLTSQLKMFFPQILQWFKEVDAPVVSDVLTAWPTLEHMQAAKPSALANFFGSHRFSPERSDQLRTALVAAIPATRDQAVIATGVIVVKRLIEQLRVLRASIKEHAEKIEELTTSHPDFEIFASLPGAGKVMIPRLIAALGTDRDRYMTAAELQCYSGIAPVISRSGQQCHTDWRRACPKFLRQTFHEWAWYSTRKCSWARQYYDTQRARKKSHHAAVRALSFKWIRILFRCWKDRSLYDEARYTAALASRTSRQAQPSVKIMWKNIAGFCKPAEIPSENA
jgi:transposase